MNSAIPCRGSPPWRQAHPLPGPEAYDRHTVLRPPPPPAENAEKIVSTYVGRHCAGLRDRASDAEVLRALQSPQDANQAAVNTIHWMMGSLEIHECMRLMSQCGVPVASLAHYARKRSTPQWPRKRFLRQFAIEDPA